MNGALAQQPAHAATRSAPAHVPRAEPPTAAIDLASVAATLLAIDPGGLGGIVVRSAAGSTRDAWLAYLGRLLSPSAAWRRLPPGTPATRLDGGLDVAATLAASRPIYEAGLLAAGGTIVVPMAERLDAAMSGRLAIALDGSMQNRPADDCGHGPAPLLVVLLDEGIGDEGAPASLAERVAFSVTLEPRADRAAEASAADIVAARRRFGDVAVGAPAYETAARLGLAFGVPSLRVARFVLRAARAHAALAGRAAIVEADLVAAAALVVAPRATTRPASADDAGPQTSPADPNEQTDGTRTPEADRAERDGDPDPANEERTTSPDAGLTEQVVAATAAALPPDLFASLADQAVGGRGGRGGRSGTARTATSGGRPIGTRRGLPGGRSRLALIDTLRAAAPWQRLRGAGAPPDDSAGRRIRVRRDDLRVYRLKQRSETLTLFVVDASGSAALHRLAEVKGAVELILADCYARRDSVALIAFRGTTSDLLLPPTRSLTRAKRALAGQPGGGGTPLASALDAAAALATAQARRGVQPLVVLLTDGRGNISRAGLPGRDQAQADAQSAAATFKLGALAALLIDIAPRPQAAARDLAAAMGARYQPLPFVDACGLSAAVRAAAPPAP